MIIKLTLVLLTFIGTPVFAGGFLGDMGPGGRNKDLSDALYTQQISGLYRPANTIQTGLRVSTDISVNNILGYELIGIYSGAVAHRDSDALHQHVTGVSGVAFKDSATAHAAGLECDVFNFKAGGSATCLRIKFTLPEPGDVGISMEPPSYATDLVGISFAKNPQAYKYATDYAGAPIAMGSKAGVVYCLQFNDATAELDYLKNCGTPSEEVVGQVAMTTPAPVAMSSTYKKPMR